MELTNQFLIEPQKSKPSGMPFLYDVTVRQSKPRWHLNLLMTVLLPLTALYLPCPPSHCFPTWDSSPHVNQTWQSWRTCSWPHSHLQSPCWISLHPGPAWPWLLCWLCCCSCLSSDLCPLGNYPGLRTQDLPTSRWGCWGLGEVPPQNTMQVWKNTSIRQERANTTHPLPQDLTSKGKYFH